MTPDFPAAHSMDTDWFAVDRDGHVAHFDTGSDGAAPVETGFSGGDFFDVENGVRRLGTVGESAWDPEGLRNNAWASHVGLRNPDECLLVLLRSAADGAALPWPGGTRALRAVSGAVFQIPRMPPPLAEALHRDGLCQGCVYTRGALDDARGADLVSRGFFHYGSFGLGIAGPYGRERFPLRPRLLADLPADVQALVRKNVFPSLCFQDETRIQPVRHFPCRTWTGLWLDGRVLRFTPGEEDRRESVDLALLRATWEAAGYTVDPDLL